MAAFAMRFLSPATPATNSNPPSTPSIPVTPPSPTSPTSSAGPSIPRPPKAKAKPPPGPSPLSVSTIAEPSRFSQVLPGVNCKECGQSIPLEKVEEHKCPPRPPMPTLPPGATSARPMARRPSNPPVLAQPPARRPSDPPRRTSPAPASRPPAPPQQQQQSPPAPSPMRSPRGDNRLRPSLENDAGPSPRRPSGENNRAKPEALALNIPASGKPSFSPPSPGPPRSPIPAQSSLTVANDPPAHPRLSTNNDQRLRDPPSPVHHSPTHQPQHAMSYPMAQQQLAPPDRITSPEFNDRASRRSNSETPYYVGGGPQRQQADQHVNDMHGSDPGHNAHQVLSTYGMPIPDTKAGGEAGMAGVGRRGFAAVAQAALIVQRTGMNSAMSHHSFGPRTPSPGVFPPGDPRAMSPGLMPGLGPNGPFPPYSPHSGPPSRMGSPNMPPMGPPPGRMGSPGQQFLGPMQPGFSPGPSPRSPPLSFGGPSPRSPERPLPETAGPSPVDERRPSHETTPGLGLSEAGPSRSPPRPKPVQEPIPSKNEDGDRSELVRTRDSRPMPKRSNTDLSHYTDDSQGPIRQDSPEPMTPEEEARLNRETGKGKEVDNRTSVASSSYTSMTIGESDRKMVSNVKTGVRNLFRKSSANSQSSASSENTSSSISVRLPFFERLKASKRSGSQSSSGSSGPALFKSASMSSTKSETMRPLGIEKALAPVQERRESIDSFSDDDVQLAYDTFDPEEEPPVKTAEVKPLAVNTSPDAAKLSSGTVPQDSGNAKGVNNSIPFPSPPETSEKAKAGSIEEAHGGVRANSLETDSGSSSSSSAVSTSMLHNKTATGKPVVGVKIVAAGDDSDGATIREATVGGGSRGLLGGDLMTGDRELESPTSSPSPTSTSFSTTSDVVTAVQKMKKKRKVRQCRKCLKIVTDGRWVAVDVGTPEAAVLCEYDWKENYLPKCRRCNLCIEGAVISATDGQISGKYHRACFTCIACNVSFPTKDFYVFDGLPHCRFHYHQANKSLCNGPGCGEPIEGPCAISDDGKKYHPEHFICEWEGGGEELPPTRRPKCNQELEDYWEFGPRKFCSERHAAWAQEKAADDKARALKEGRPVVFDDTASISSQATKRRTIFITEAIRKREL